MKNTKLYAVGMAIIALLGIISRLLDKQLAKLLFKSGNFIGGLCEIVGKIIVNKDGERGVVMEATQNIYAKNQIDTRKICNVKEFIK